ncbi:tetratricopeptide repeat protein [Bacteroides sp.]|uniref:tetratricopeptide repeat protein n=1 Tax=Bacteroides sp. TaxID=29523 RepID=UPI001B78A01B|nr:tetratricopeptide repeat protein [Bacteroides sp.]MBP6064610.1 tetratricopeptide repeat protein [Bacteroides sp.]MBP6066951.1 tetratricopeptide repeat protein [Bacteroides sp.]MBP6935835.1 tetratricopeptide repeat protein [Bacteroides sp.]MBP8622249.1 tetratricopeptide repeat protein [Bacteroides sp.]MBP9506816.1 tetratricopeptide repeat protein [Bacteroides sp.]
MKQLKTIKELINEGKVEEAIQALDQLILTDSVPKDEAYYLRGNAYRKQGNWQQALNNYQESIELNPQGPATEARRMVMDIMNFFNKDMFNQ